MSLKAGLKAGFFLQKPAKSYRRKQEKLLGSRGYGTRHKFAQQTQPKTTASMKYPILLSSIAILLSFNAFAQTGPEYLSISISSAALPQPVVMTIGFSSIGSNGFNSNDTTTQNTSAIDTTNSSTSDSVVVNNRRPLIPFTLSTDSIRIDRYDSRPELTGYTSFSFGVAAYQSSTIILSANSFFGIDSINI